MSYIVLFVVATWASGLQVSQKPVVDMPIVADVYDLPKTLEGLVDRADAVILAKILRATDVSQGQRARTDYSIQLLSVAKEHANLFPQSIICRAIGRVERPNRIVRKYQVGLPSFEPGREYLLFLSWEGDKGCFSPAFGPSGAAIMDTAGVRPFVSNPALDELKGMKEPDVTKRLAQARAHRK